MPFRLRIKYFHFIFIGATRRAIVSGDIDRSAPSEIESMTVRDSDSRMRSIWRHLSRAGILFLILSTMAQAIAAEVAPPGVFLQPSSDGVIRAKIEVDSYLFKPDHLIVPMGHPVELTLESKTFIVPHNFVIKAPEIGVEVNQEVPAGHTVTVTFTPTAPGKAEIYCDKKLLFFKSHKEKGMVGILEIREAADN